ncbi:MAG TPA: nucleotide sugar dehydrogenase [Hyphomicrobium sp.]|nr:nucleotide sugar dehydrogenase [Hyphomicrobium sp.]
MRVCVMGLWHLGTVTAACVAKLGHDVVGLDDQDAVVVALRNASPPVFEPGLEDLVRERILAGRLRFTTDVEEAASEADVLWVTYDTPVDENDVADTEYVLDRVKSALSLLPAGALVVISSQLPVGSCSKLAAYSGSIGRADLVFAYSPENLRLGKAIDVFLQPDRVVVGVNHLSDRAKVQELLSNLNAPIEWMSIESAEMTKHAINGFLAMSIAFANEIAAVCEVVGADAREVAKGLKTEARIGRQAYVAPGVAFAGGTLARDIAFLSQIGVERDLQLELLPAVRVANDIHKSWAIHRLKSTYPTLAGRRIAILGLTYKPGTDTLRRSSSVELALAVKREGASVVAYDPKISNLPPELEESIELVSSPSAAVAKADAVVIATEWPEFNDLNWTALLGTMSRQVVVDPNGMIQAKLPSDIGARYSRVGFQMSSVR